MWEVDLALGNHLFYVDRPTGHVSVRMTPGEIALAAQIAVDRIKMSRLDPKRTPTYDAGWEKALPCERDGVLAEHAVYKFLDCWCHGTLVIGERLPCDDGGIEVKSTRRENGGLAIQPDEKVGIPAVLAVVAEPFVRVAGWIWIEMGREQRWWRPDWKKPAYCVPQGHLRKPLSLLEWRLGKAQEEMGRRIQYISDQGGR